MTGELYPRHAGNVESSAMDYDTFLHLGSLPNIGWHILLELRNHFDEKDEAVRQIVCQGEEAGELLKAWRRAHGWARKTGTWEEVEDEWADNVITTFVTGAALGYSGADMSRILAKKFGEINTRGWRDAGKMA